MSKQLILRLLLAALAALVLAVALTPVAYLVIALGVSPGVLPVAAWLIPLLGVAGGALIAGAGPARVPALQGGLIGGAAVLLWALVWCFLLGRGNLADWWRQGILGLTGLHLLAWLLTLGTGVLAGWLGGRLRAYRYGVLAAGLGLVVLLPLVLVVAGLLLPDTGHTVTLAPGATLRRAPYTADGTSRTLLTIDFAQNPRLALAVYDNDQHDATPGDDRNTSWLGTPVRTAWPGIQAEARRHRRRALCAWNGNFFGFDAWYHGWHLAPQVSYGRAAYPGRVLDAFPEQDWQLGLRRVEGRMTITLAKDVPPSRWQRDFTMALGGVRPLRRHGQSLPLAPGRGNTTLRCARTSLGWTEDASRLYVLIAHDLDGEAAAKRQKARAVTRQTGGMSLPELQRYWEARHVPNAVILDGGDSTQLAYAAHTVPSGYLVSCTPAYLRARPLRLYLPMLPPPQQQLGVMNYVYLVEE